MLLRSLAVTRCNRTVERSAQWTGGESPCCQARFWLWVSQHAAAQLPITQAVYQNVPRPGPEPPTARFEVWLLGEKPMGVSKAAMVVTEAGRSASELHCGARSARRELICSSGDSGQMAKQAGGDCYE